MRAAAPSESGWLNVYPDHVPLEAVDDVRPVAMHLACRRRGVPVYVLLVLDLDCKDGDAASVDRQARELTALAEAEGIGVVRAVSGPGGGVHLWMGCLEGVSPGTARRIALAARALCPAVDPSPLLNPRTGAVRPPGAAHRHGGHARLVSHDVGAAVRVLGEGSAPAAAFAAFADRLEAVTGRQQPPVAGLVPVPRPGGDADGAPPSIARRGPVLRRVVRDGSGRPRLDVPFRPLGPRAVEALRRVPDAAEERHSRLVHAPLRAMAAAGWDLDQVSAAVADAEATPALEWLRTSRAPGGRGRVDHGLAERRRRLGRAWWLAVQDAARLPRQREPVTEGGVVEAAVVDLVERMRAAGPARWARPSGPADQAVLYAVAYLMLTANRLEVSANVRRVGVLAGYSRQTASASLWRLIRDGWLTVTGEADMSAGTARRVALATGHVCPGDRHHVCAVHRAGAETGEQVPVAVRRDQDFADEAPAGASPTAPAWPTPLLLAGMTASAAGDADVVTGHHGSDRRRNAAPVAAPRTSLTPATVRSHVGSTVAHHQGDPWDELGHHAGRTLLWLRGGRGPVITGELPRALGYAPSTIRRHLRTLHELGLVALGSDHAGRPTVRATGRTLARASRDTGTHGRTPAAAATAAVDAARHAWWTAEVAWSRLPRAAKRDRGRRAAADQQVIPGTDPTARAYPRDAYGRADHARAHAIEHHRLDGDALRARAQHLADTEQVIDPGTLAPAGNTRALVPGSQAA